MKITFTKNIEGSLLFYTLIVLSCMNFFGRGSLLYLIFALFAIIKISPVIKIDSNFFFAALLTFAVAVAAVIFYDLNEVVKAFNYVLLYLIGHNGFIAAKNKLKFAKQTIFAIFAGFTLNVILTYIYNRDIKMEGQRILYSIWTKEPIAVTLVGLLSSVIIGYSIYAIFLHKKLLMKMTGIISVVVMFLINVKTATRTPIILFVIVYLFVFVVGLFNTDWTKKIKWLVLGVIAIILLIVIYVNDTFGIQTYISSSPIFHRFEEEGVETSRIDITVHYFKNMFNSLWGGEKISDSYGKLAHNFIQEGHDKYGIFATIALLGLAVNFIRNVIKLIRVKEKKDIDFLFISMYVAMIIQICLEPVFDGYPVVIMSLLMIHGIATAYLSKRDDLIRSEAI